MSDDVHAARRARVLDRLGADGALLVAAAPELIAAGDTELRYLPDADLFYLTGYTEPEAVLVLCPSADTPYALFVRPRDADRERWTGVRGGVEAARASFGCDVAHPIADLVTHLPRLLADASVLHTMLEPQRADVMAALHATLLAARRTRARTGRGVFTLVDASALLGSLRMRKDAHELALIRDAADISVAAFHDAARALRDAAGEWQIETAVEHGFRRRGASGPAFPTIAAAGANATVLHYVANDAPLRRGDLLLLDAGARVGMYCADITRTFPIGGTFTADQRALYDIVLAAHDAALAEVRPGCGAGAPHDAALRVLIDGMRDLGLLSGSTDDLLQRDEYRRYYPHRTSHWLGLDVHDAGPYVHDDGAPVRLEPGMVLTIEPGIYVPADDQSAPPALRGIGIRLEDDALVTLQGHEVLTGRLPIRPDDVAALLSARASR